MQMEVFFPATFMSGRIRFVELLEGIAESHNLTLNRYCSDWIIRFENSSHRCFQIYGYSFDANGSGCYQVWLSYFNSLPNFRSAATRMLHPIF
jgi:hypothetical protein